VIAVYAGEECGGSGDAGKKREEKRAEDRGLASEIARETKWLGVAGATEQKRGRDMASLWEIAVAAGTPACGADSR
jgi:hypothetical protein